MRLLEVAVTRKDFVTLRAAFNEWALNDARMGPLVKEELTSLSMGLSAAGRIGLHALDYLEKHEQPTARMGQAAERSVGWNGETFGGVVC